MIHNILVPLDGSPVSEAALPYAIALAGRTGARLTLMRAAHIAPFVARRGRRNCAHFRKRRRTSNCGLQTCVHATASSRPACRTAGAPRSGSSKRRRCGTPISLSWVHTIASAPTVGCTAVWPRRWSAVHRYPCCWCARRMVRDQSSTSIGASQRSSSRWTAPSSPKRPLPAAIALARSLNGRVVLVSVTTETSPSVEDPGAHGYLESLVDRLTRAGVSVASLVRTGRAGHGDCARGARTERRGGADGDTRPHRPRAYRAGLGRR